MKRSYVIALAGISAALAYVATILSFYVDIMSLTLGALAGICLMLPLCVKSVTGAIFAYVSTSVLAGLTVGFGAMPFIIFFGPFTIVGYLVDMLLYYKMHFPKWAKLLICYSIKGVCYAGTVTALYFVMSLFGNVDALLSTNWVWLFVFVLIVIFFLFDLLLRLVFVNLRYIINKRILKNTTPANDIQNETKQEKRMTYDDIFSMEKDDHKEKNDDKEPDDEQVVKNAMEDDSSSRFKHFLESEEREDKDKEENKKD